MVNRLYKIYMVKRMRTNALFNFIHISQIVGVTGMAGVAQLVELWIVIPITPSNISYLTTKRVRINGSDADKIRTNCRQIERRNMENFEGWDLHPIRKNTFIIPSESICLIV